MYVIKRDGQREKMQFDKITVRLNALMWDLDTDHVQTEEVTRKIVASIKPGMKTSEIDTLASETAAGLCYLHPHYDSLAARILISNLHKQTPPCFSQAMELLNQNVTDQGFFADDYMTKVRKHSHILDSAIIHQHDFNYDYVGTCTLLKSYLLCDKNRNIVERPQYMLMRVALALNLDNITNALVTYRALSQKQYIHASPTLMNAGVRNGQYASCFLLEIPQDSLDSIYQTLHQCATISKYTGGIGMSVHRIRAAGSLIKSSRGTSTGLVPMLRVFNDTARYVDQGGGKRNGSIAVYVEPWHADIFQFLDLRKNTGTEHERCRDLFLALWVPDLFMQRVESDSEWSLFSEDTAPGLSACYGQQFNELYERYEKEGKALRVVKARAVWNAILDAQITGGTPYLLYKDACNAKSNQKNLGTIRCSNLCAEILEYTSEKEIATCNLASINLAEFVQGANFNYELLHEITQLIVRNLNRVIDCTYYPLPQAEYSNKRHRPLGLGVQGLADTFLLLGLPYDSKEAQEINKNIFETIYHASMTASWELAKKQGPYETFSGSPLSKGLFQFDLWNKPPSSDRYDWDTLRHNIVKDGVCNSLVVACMPTATTSNIMGQNDSFEPFSSNLFLRRVKAGDFVAVNRHLVRDLQALNLWNREIIQQIIVHSGSIQKIDDIPANVKLLYRTAYEIPTKVQIDMSADRGVFICQTQSFNIYRHDISLPGLTKMHMYGWKSGLKTGIYYLRSAAAVDPIKITLDNGMLIAREEQKNKDNTTSVGHSASATTSHSVTATTSEINENPIMCSRLNGCVSCSS